MKGYEIKTEGPVEVIEQNEETATLNVSGKVITINFGDDIKEAVEKVNKALKEAKKSLVILGTSLPCIKEFVLKMHDLQHTAKYELEPNNKDWLPGSFKKRGRK